ncbi:MAG: Gfo/Idh/MocA family oxidoreductase [Chloroflexota bacterium]
MSSDRALSVAIVGCGQMGRKHAINCQHIEGVSIVAVADVDIGRAEALAAEVRAVPYSRFDELIEHVAPDALIVTTPPTERLHIVEAATSKKIAVFVEKPIALDLSTAKKMCHAAHEASIINAVGFQLRYSPLTQHAKTLISGRRVTHVRTATTTDYYLKMDMPPWFLQRRLSGGPLLEQSLHVFDAARYLIGDITEVTGRGDRLIRPDLAQFDSEDTMVLAYRFGNGALGTHIDSCAMGEFNWEVELFGTDWRLLVDYARKCLRGHVNGKAVQLEATEDETHMQEMGAFLGAVRHRKNDGVLSDFANATKTLAVMLAGDRSLRTGVWEPVNE